MKICQQYSLFCQKYHSGVPTELLMKICRFFRLGTYTDENNRHFFNCLKFFEVILLTEFETIFSHAALVFEIQASE